MLVVTSVFVSTLDWLKNRLEISIYDKRRLVGVAELFEFYVGLLSV